MKQEHAEDLAFSELIGQTSERIDKLERKKREKSLVMELIRPDSDRLAIRQGMSTDFEAVFRP
jgi:hypothetical protein